MSFGFANALPAYNLTRMVAPVAVAYSAIGAIDTSSFAQTPYFTSSTGSNLLAIMAGYSASGSTIGTYRGKLTGALITQNGTTVTTSASALISKLGSWYKTGPATNVANSYFLYENQVGPAASEDAVAGTYFSGVNQASPIGTTATATGTSTAFGPVTASVTIATNAGDFVCAVVGFMDNNLTLTNINAPFGSNTSVFSVADPANFDNYMGTAVVGKIATSASTTITINCNSLGTPNAAWSIQAFVLNPA